MVVGRCGIHHGMAQQEQGFLIILNMPQVLSLEDIRYLSQAAKGS